VPPSRPPPPRTVARPVRGGYRRRLMPIVTSTYRLCATIFLGQPALPAVPQARQPGLSEATAPRRSGGADGARYERRKAPQQVHKGAEKPSEIGIIPLSRAPMPADPVKSVRGT